MRKRILLVLGVLMTLLIVCGDVTANIDNLSNMSTEWMRTGNRNAATDRADAVIYNPGGITELPDGFSINIGNQTMMREPEHSFTDPWSGQKRSCEQDGMDLFLPNFYIAYNKDNWSVWGGIYIPGGGAVVDYPDGSITTALIGAGAAQTIATTYGIDPSLLSITNESLEAESIYMTYTVGSTVQINEILSIAFGLRYIDAENNVKGGATVVVPDPVGAQPLRVDFDQEADGAGFIVGMNLNLTETVNLGLQYQSRVALDFEYDVKTDDTGTYLALDGTKTQRDFPAMFGLGVGYDMSEKVYLEANYSYWFQKMADWDSDSAGRDISNMAGDTQSVGATGTYKLTDAVAVSGGVVFTDFMWENRNGYYEANVGSYEVLFSDNYQVAGGASWQITDMVEVNFALARTIWKDADLRHFSGVEISTQNATTTFAIGANLNF